jgi:hypothetical protein
MTVNISEPDLKTSSSLIAFTHQSQRETGEDFSTELTYRAISTPYFRIVPDARVTVNLRYELAYSAASNIIGAVIDTATHALNALAPKADLLTELNREEVNKAAEFFDSTINAVLDENLVELISIEHGIEEGGVAEFAVQVPDHRAENIAQVGIGEFKQMGNWRVALDLPRLSIWSEYSPCWRIGGAIYCPDDEEIASLPDRIRYAKEENFTLCYLTAEEALQRKASADISLGAHIRDQDWFTKSVSDLNKDDADATIQTSFCRSVLRTASELGLNSVDTHVTLWAILNATAISVSARDRALAGGCSEQHQIFEALELGWQS